MTTQVNGINLDTLNQTIGAVKQDPELGRCRFRASNKWLRGNRNVGKVSSYYAAKQESQHRETFEARADEPPLLAGDDTAPNPVEHLLLSLAACLTTSIVAHAAVRGIQIEELESQIEGEIDLNGFMGLTDAPRGFQKIRVNFEIKSDADGEQLRRLAEFSPVFNTITNGCPVDLDIRQKPMQKGRPVSGAARHP